MTTMNSYRALVTSTFVQGEVQHTTYVAARSAAQAKRQLQREGYTVIQLWVLEFAT